MYTLICQLVVLTGLACLVVAWVRAWPYPSPVIRRFLPPRLRWPEAQIRAMLDTGRLHPGYLAFFNRDPVRDVSAGEDLLAPADGLLLSAETAGAVRYIVIALSFWDVHVQRSPLAGRVRTIETLGDAFRDGEGRDFAFLAAKHCPVQKRIVIDAGADEIAIRLVTSIAARRIEVWPSPGDSLARGERLGRILLGSTVVLEVPMHMRCALSPGVRVRAGETVLVTRDRATSPAR
ncbi:phosphatidylserine decarboxylase [Salinisphaera sp. Q1T1-3]|uniref:phosphatidylserine decarboxylase n=1 Tax=Salinisphaera sp. Q1T1-3 TaxID=2321229 RepID=UPI000E743398|nr:phosphatidylserine decarboxylase [Salinisphaera sp. Q1T1-3]RJS94735.1 phosphatidylserine decarboxylase [Salinisphaera sp. Q1T1-3]